MSNSSHVIVFTHPIIINREKFGSLRASQRSQPLHHNTISGVRDMLLVACPARFSVHFHVKEPYKVFTKTFRPPDFCSFFSVKSLRHPDLFLYSTPFFQDHEQQQHSPAAKPVHLAPRYVPAPSRQILPPRRRGGRWRGG